MAGRSVSGAQANPSYCRGPRCRIEAVHENKPSQSLIQDARDRSHTGLFLIEGIRHVARAAEEHAPIHTSYAQIGRCKQIHRGRSRSSTISRKWRHDGAVHVEFGAEDHGKWILYQQDEYRDVHDA